MDIKILGPGCMNCKRLEEVVKKATSEMNEDVDIAKITDYSEIIQYNILTTPGLVINGNVVSSGRIPSIAEIKAWITENK